jgi:hypothetical protein
MQIEIIKSFLNGTLDKNGAKECVGGVKFFYLIKTQHMKIQASKPDLNQGSHQRNTGNVEVSIAGWVERFVEYVFLIPRIPMECMHTPHLHQLSISFSCSPDKEKT